jgi:hypothetical protein
MKWDFSFYYYTYYTDNKIEVHRGEITCPRLLAKKVDFIILTL